MKKSGIRVRICRRCKDPIHEKSIHEYCPRCYKIVEEVFDKIRDYLKEYPGATAYEMEQRLRIPIHVIKNFIKDGRLVEIPNQFLNIECLRCGCLLLSVYHKYCPACEAEMKRTFEKVKKELGEPGSYNKDKGKMHLTSYLRNK